MKRAILQCLLTALLAIPVHAAQPQPESPPAPPVGAANEAAVSEKAAADVTEPLIPKRELVFEEQSEPLEMELFAADPKLLEQRYVAVFRLSVPYPYPSSKGFESLPKDLHELYQMGLPVNPRAPLSERFVSGIPQERLPSKDIVSVFTAEVERHLQRDLSGPSAKGRKAYVYYLDFKVLAPSAKRARELTEGLLSLYDYGLSYPIQQGFLHLRQEREGVLPEKRAELEKARQELADLQKQLKQFDEFADLGEKSLTNLTTQRRLIAVDLAGVEARIDACSKILATPKTPGYASQVEILQITAQIELVGLKAEEAYINSIVEKGRERQELLHKAKIAQGNARLSENRVSSVEASMADYEAERRRFMPFPVEGERIAVHAIKWQSAANDKSP